jgi:hypothetical protein
LGHCRNSCEQAAERRGCKQRRVASHRAHDR